MLVGECHDGHHDMLSLGDFQEGLGQHPHAHGVPVLGEDDGVLAQAHGARLEAVPVEPHGHAAVHHRLLTEAKAARWKKTSGGWKIIPGKPEVQVQDWQIP